MVEFKKAFQALSGQKPLRDSRSEIETIKSRAGIVDIISEYVVLKKAGRNFVGLCPFHKEKTPSFSVNAEKQIFYCFGCGAGGDVFEFLIRLNNMSFPEALSHLAEKTGVALQERHPGQPRAEKTLREEVKRINRLAEKKFTKNLSSNSGRSAREYLRKRGIQDATVSAFQLGLALNGWRHLRDYFEQEKISLPLVEKAGLIIRSEKGDFYDRFRGRLIFPIEDISGEVVAFGGRAAGDEKPKYLNSPESPVYIKGRNLYALNRAKEEIRKQGYVILVEGYFDVLSLWNAGICNVVAALGTALTREHLDLLRRFTTNIVAIFDPDEGGRSALERSLTLFLEEKFHARVVILPDNLDPDDYIKKYGNEAMVKLIMASQSLVDYYIENVIGSKRGFEEDFNAVREAVPFIARIEDPVQKNLFIKRVAEKLNIDQGLLKSEIAKLSSNRRAPSEPIRKAEDKQNSKATDPVEMTLIRLITEFPQVTRADFDEQIFNYFQNPVLQRLGRELSAAIRSGSDFLLSDFLNGIENESLRDKLLRWAVSESPFEGVAIETLFKDTTEKVKIEWFKAQKKALSIAAKQAQEKGDTERLNRIAFEKNQLLKKEKQSL